MVAAVVAVDIEQPTLDLVAELRAAHLADASTTDPVEAISALGGLDVYLSTIDLTERCSSVERPRRPGAHSPE
ncbi:MAG: hypothetical protein Q7T56_09155 [Nocardioidaceae bacterium]|nr:hypothetical protein [Nocardioidaceae bacterium]